MTIATATPATKPVRGRIRRVAWPLLLWLLVLPGAVWALLRLGGWEQGLMVQLFAFTPYVAAWSVVPVIAALATRRRLAGAVAAVTLAVFAMVTLPRALADGDRGPQGGVALHVMTSNLLFGNADAAEIVRLVRANAISVLALQEFSPRAQTRLAEAGLGDLLPYSSLGPEYGAGGSGLYSRFPITNPGVRHNNGGFKQAYGTIQPPGAGAVVVESAHPLAPYSVEVLDVWRNDLMEEPGVDPNGLPRILLGDFNSTLDHAPLRDLIDSGYRDAADADGAGLTGTWGPYDGDPLPPVTIDHVLVDERLGVGPVSVHDVPGSDHRAILAEVRVPAA
ncbi:endonuclease/exonuclease/phosphatase family protein [Amorphoplanes digitatis]|uniref:Endonuclease/exonuclease/phosphatase family metal-dependent hydrolase n=1 Tax=Actinoplanes digitatis TaxID=1868 RepID=A0A7W7MNF3_9ACTN|nr:endonuclease/exonuclease/phosphatase family protein [Actinoplanes digitatis]MBB4760279.1 endonuclease/exonuclease/phosphatase family metal-dependent hydrolase [Actinoplanes digitatis]GID98132.1 endonuclease [Actinoplanes digitatis]